MKCPVVLTSEGDAPWPERGHPGRSEHGDRADGGRVNCLAPFTMLTERVRRQLPAAQQHQVAATFPLGQLGHRRTWRWPGCCSSQLARPG